MHAYQMMKVQQDPNFQLVIEPGFPDEQTMADNPDRYFTEIVQGKEYQTVLP